MSNKKKIVDARSDKNGNITEVKLSGNITFTRLETAIRMTERGQVDAVVVNPKDGSKHLRTRPDDKTKNNLDEMAHD
jgi:4-hydroxy-L-threonine phosphate dehydrogenase PdxA